MPNDIFIGADGGGTKTKIQVEDEQGRILAAAKSGPANIRTSVETAWHSIDTGVAEALLQAQLSLDDPRYHYHIGLGLAGTEVAKAKAQFLARPHPFTTLVLESDAYAACLGVHSAKDGAIIIVGTGVIGYQVEQGHVARVGGWGFPHADEGGGAWLGMEAVRLTFQWLDGRLAETPMLAAIFEHFDNDMQHLVSWANEAKPVDYGQIAPFVILHLQNRDPHAEQLIERSAQEIDLVGAALEEKTIDQSRMLPCCLLGGIAPFVEPRLGKRLRSRLVKRQHSAEKGAIFMVKNALLSQQ